MQILHENLGASEKTFVLTRILNRINHLFLMKISLALLFLKPIIPYYIILTPNEALVILEKL